MLGRSLDELPPQTRRLLESIKALVRTKMKAESTEQKLCLFSRRELREFSGWGQMQVRRHLERLQEMEYVRTCGGRNGVSMQYALMVDLDESADAYHVGLIDVAKLKPAKIA